MRKKIIGITALSFVILLFVFCCLVLGQNLYYENRWYPGTMVNGVPVSGCTLEESGEKMKEYFDDYALTITGRDGISARIPGEDIGYSVHANDSWNKAFEAQHDSIFLPFASGGVPDMDYDITYDETALREIVSRSALVTGDASHPIQKPAAAYVTYDTESKQYTAVEEVKGNQVDLPALLELIAGALMRGEKRMDLTGGDDSPAYVKPAVTLKDESLQKQLGDCNNAVLRFIRWEFGKDREEVIGPDQIARWVEYKKGKIRFDEKGIEDWSESFCRKYCTVGKKRTFKNHAGKKVTVPGGDYGWQISAVQTAKQLKRSLQKKISREDTERYRSAPSADTKEPLVITNKPAYLTIAHKLDFEGEIRDWDQKNYVEVSLKDQKVYVFRNGKVAFSCRCISGLPVEGRATRTGVYYIKEHRTNYTMIGEDYKTFVRYWVRITWTGTGFHPASWQPWSRWTKDLYKTKGSHGCLNLEPADAEKIYHMLKYREAVFIY